MNFKRYTAAEMYISPFTRRRTTDEAGHVIYVENPRNLKPTGCDCLDFIAREFSEGHTSYQRLASQMGVSCEDLCTLLRVMTVGSSLQLRRDLLLLTADDLLRYTDLPISEIARRCGASTAANLGQLYHDHRHTFPSARRRALRQEGDLGRFLL